MVFLLVGVKKSFPSSFVKEFNSRLSGGGNNPALIFFDGTARLSEFNKEKVIFFNLRINPFEPPFYKWIFYFMFKKKLKKQGIKGKTRILDKREFSRYLEALK